MLILVLLGMYFDAVVIFVTSQTLLFRLALAILCELHLKYFQLAFSGINFYTEFEDNLEINK